MEYNFPIIKCDNPVKLNFANTTTAIAEYYADLVLFWEEFFYHKKFQ